jgi:hypothetical protein
MNWKLALSPALAPEDGAGSGFFTPDAGDGANPGPSGTSQPPSGQNAAPRSADSGSESATRSSESTQTSDPNRPEWLLPKFRSPEDQAKAYSDLYGRFSTKTELLKAEVKAEAVAEYGKTIGVPDDPTAYEYPEGFKAPAEPVDVALRSWAKENNVSPEGFQKLIAEVHGINQTSYQAELEKLGDRAPERIGEVNRWITRNVDKALFPEVERVMQTAAGVELIETLMGKTKSAGFAPQEGQQAPRAISREEIRAMQADPRFGEDDAYTAQVRQHWAEFAKRGGK